MRFAHVRLWENVLVVSYLWNYNYPREFSYYWASQQMLAEQHPAIYDEFKEVGFSVWCTFVKFNKLSPGQVIEQTIIKDKNLQVYKSAFKMHPLSELVFDIRFRKTINILYNNIFVLWFKVIILFMGVISWCVSFMGL